jgi:hypothetical protein
LNAETIPHDVYRRNRFACQFFLRRDIAMQFPFSENRELKIGEDWEVVLRIAVRFPLHFTNQVHAAIVRHSGRTMEMAGPDVILKSRDILLENLKADKRIEVSRNIPLNVRVELTSLAALSAVLHGNRKLGFNLLMQSVGMRFGTLFSRRSAAILKRVLFGNPNREAQ